MTPATPDTESSMERSFYFAGAYGDIERHRKLAGAIEAHSGWPCTSHWLDAGSEERNDDPEVAAEDRSDVERAAALVVRGPSPRGGTWVEMGMAIALRKPVILLGSPGEANWREPPVFWTLPECVRILVAQGADLTETYGSGAERWHGDTSFLDAVKTAFLGCLAAEWRAALQPKKDAIRSQPHVEWCGAGGPVEDGRPIGLVIDAESAPSVEDGDIRAALRRTAACRPGDRLQLWSGSEEEQWRDLGEARCTVVRRAEVRGTEMMLDGIRLPATIECRDQLEPTDNEVAERLGFAMFMDLARWADDAYGLPFHGYLVEWELRG